MKKKFFLSIMILGLSSIVGGADAQVTLYGTSYQPVASPSYSGYPADGYYYGPAVSNYFAPQMTTDTAQPTTTTTTYWYYDQSPNYVRYYQTRSPYCTLVGDATICY